jgi:hypothetical protein
LEVVVVVVVVAVEEVVVSSGTGKKDAFFGNCDTFLLLLIDVLLVWSFICYSEITDG